MKKIATVVLAFVIIIGLTGCSNTIKIPKASTEYIGTNYEIVVSELEKLGFTDIETIEIQDLNSNSQLSDYSVGEITINGTAVFEEKATFEKEAKVVITYHTIPKLNIPLSTDEVQSFDYETIASMFYDAGFSDIVVQELYDLDPDLTDAEFENEVTINESHEFTKGTGLAFDSKISIICHRPFTRHTVKINIDFISNLLFNRYDVVISVDDDEQELLTHGQDSILEFSLKEGIHTFSFEKEGDYSICGEFDLEVDSEIEASYSITCGSSEVSIKENFVDRIISISDDEVKVLGAKSEFTLKNYKDVVSTLKEWGFANIEEVPLYDIYFGWTEEGSVETVTINGSDNYKRGDIFKKNAEVVVNYHLNYQDDPNRPSDNETTSTEPSSVFYSTNTRETVNNGNSGIYSYKSKGGSYDIYWIIDFDAGYVYYFCEGNGDTTCDKLKIDFGDLNTYVQITYHDGNDVWSNKLHFKYVNHAEHLVMNDHNGFDFDYYTTDLSDALALRNTKTIKEY